MSEVPLFRRTAPESRRTRPKSQLCLSYFGLVIFFVFTPEVDEFVL